MQPASLSEHLPARMTPEHVRHRYFGTKNVAKPTPTRYRPHLHATYYPPPKKNKIDTEHRVCGLRVHHNCHKKIGIVEFFRTGSEPALAPLPPLIYIYIYIPQKKREKNKSDADNCVSVLRLRHKYRKKIGIVEFFRTRPEPTLCEATTPLRYTLPPTKKRGKTR